MKKQKELTEEDFNEGRWIVSALVVISSLCFVAGLWFDNYWKLSVFLLLLAIITSVNMRYHQLVKLVKRVLK